MSGFAGQAVRASGRVARALVQFLFALVLTSIVLLALLSWRLSRGPLDLPWLARALVQSINADQTARVAVGGAALAWEGFSGGVDQPIDIQVRDIVLTDAAGARIATIPRAAVSLSPRGLLFGEIVPRAVEIDGARLLVVRDLTGDVTLDLGARPLGGDDAPADVTPSPSAEPADAAASVLRQFVKPPTNDQSGASSRWSQLRHVRLRDAGVTVIDRQLGATWALRGLRVDLERADAGGIVGSADGSLRLGHDIAAPLRVMAVLDQRTGHTDVAASIGQFVPAALARAVPAWAALAPFEMPATLRGTARLAPDLTPGQLSATINLAAGALHVGASDITVLGGTMTAEGTLARAVVDISELRIAPRPDGRPSTARAHAELARSAAGDVAANATLDLDEVAFADLPAYWPPGAGGPGARKWVTQNIQEGTASHAHVEVGLHVPADFTNVEVTRLAGGVDGADLSVAWLRPVPPVDHVAARLTLNGPDSISIAVTSGTQEGGHDGGPRVQGGRVVITGLAAADQFADIDLDVAGTIPDLVTLLRNPRLHLLDKSPLPLNGATGQIAGHVTVTKLPLRDGVTMDDVAIHATAKSTGFRLPGIIAGHDVDQGNSTIDVTQAGVRVTGTAVVGGIEAQAQLDLDFRVGPKTQIVLRASATATADAKRFEGLGIDTGGLLSGPVGMSVTLAQQRGGVSEARIEADLSAAVLSLPPLGFTKPVGGAARLSAVVRMRGGDVTEIAPIGLTGDGVGLDATLGFARGRPDLLTLRRAVVGSGTDVTGTVAIPQAAGDPWRVRISGASLDLSSQFAHTPKLKEPAPPPERGPSYIADATLDRVVLSKARPVANVVAHIENDGLVIRRLSVTGRTLRTGGGARGEAAPFKVDITPQGTTRVLAASTGDAGGLLLALDIDDKIEGGRMTINGSYDDTLPDRPLAATAIVEDFRVHNAPFLAKLLQAMTLYGLVQVAQGPGLGFTRLEAPFRDDGAVLTLSNARAFNPSLGMTAKGDIDLTTRRADLEGTIVPAYFFNSLLGDIPLIGRLFSPEKGGGLFAATYSVRGSLDDPSVSVNPLAALTPGFLRGVFGVFDSPDKPGAAPTPPQPSAPDRR